MQIKKIKNKVRKVQERLFPALTPYRLKLNRIRFKIQYKNLQDRFRAIHGKNYWGSEESISGPGSSLEVTNNILSALRQILSNKQLASVVDIPCGDYNWMSQLGTDIHYTGVDIVPELIEQNKHRYSSDKVRFLCLDATRDSLPDADLLICRDMLNHLSLPDAQRALQNFSETTAQYFLITQYSETRENEPQESGFRYRPLNLQKAPFDLPEPSETFYEYDHTDGQPKAMCLWTREQFISTR